MLYTLSRFRFHNPKPPFELGGEYFSSAGQNYLRDAAGLVAVLGSPHLFENLNEGDLVVVQVEATTSHQSVRVSDLRVEFKSAGGWSLPPRPHAIRFAAFIARLR